MEDNEYNEVSEQEIVYPTILSPSRKRSMQEEDQNGFTDDEHLNDIEEMEPHKKAKKDVEVIEVMNDTDEQEKKKHQYYKFSRRYY